MSTDPTHRNDHRRAREVAEARAALERRAAELGVKPFDGDEWLGQPEAGQDEGEVTREVDEFLRMMRGWRDAPSGRGIG